MWEKLNHQLTRKRFHVFNKQWNLFEVGMIVLGLYFIVTFERLAILQLVILLIAVILHEVAHGWVAYKLGDPTAKNQGRLNLNPVVHMDLLGSLILPGLLLLSGSGFIIGWAKPVPINPHYFKHPTQGLMWVAIAGPLTNIALALLSSGGLQLIKQLGTPSTTWLPILIYTLQYSIVINLVLAIFNLIPVPPLDGSRILSYLSPKGVQDTLYKLEPYGILIILVLVYFGVFGIVLNSVLPPLLSVLV